MIGISKIQAFQLLILLVAIVLAASIHYQIIGEAPEVVITRAETDQRTVSEQPAPAPANLENARTTPAVKDEESEITPSPSQTQEIVLVSINHARELYDQGEVQFVDARSSGEYAKGHIAGALNLPFSEFSRGAPDAIDLLIPEFPVVVYCEGGDCDSAKLVAKHLSYYGFSDLYIIEDGYPGWLDRNLPIETAIPQ